MRNLVTLKFLIFIGVNLISLLLISSFSTPVSTSVFAAPKVFQDNFEDGNADGWTTFDEGTGFKNYWEVKNIENSKRYGIYIGQESIRTYALAGDPSWTDYIYEVDMLPMKGEDKNLLWRVKDPQHFYALHYNNQGLWLHKIGPDRFDPNLPVPPELSYPVNYKIQNGITYHLRIEVIGAHIKLFIYNGEETKKVFDFEDTNKPYLNGAIGLYASTGGSYPTEIWFDNIVVTSLEEETKTPVVLLPGMGASWNSQKMLLGQEVPQSEWQMTFFVRSYDGLIASLEKAGYKKGEDLFIFNYDWTKPLNLIADDLKTYIDEVVNPPPDGKVNLVGHSLGGLVARTYLQKNPASHGVDKLITLGSPHKGVPQVYEAWEGADLHDLANVPIRLGAEFILALRGQNYGNKVEALRNITPSMRNLLPIFDYLKWEKDGQIIPESSLPASSRNLWLKNLGAPPALLNLLTTIVGTTGETPRWLRLIPRDKTDELLGRWAIGKPIKTETAEGDTTVLALSAQLEGAKEVSLLSLDHGGLVEDRVGIKKVLETLGEEETEPVTFPSLAYEPTLVFTLASPANLRVSDPQGRQVGVDIDLPTIPNATYSAEEKMILIREALDGEYQIEVIGEATGAYKLLVGQLGKNQDIWSQYQGETAPGKMDNYTLPQDKTLTTTDSYLAKLINRKIEALFLQIEKENIPPKLKNPLRPKLTQVWNQTKPIPAFLAIGKNREADKNVQKAIGENKKLADYLRQKSVPNLLPPVLEIQDLLSKLHDLLNL